MPAPSTSDIPSSHPTSRIREHVPGSRGLPVVGHTLEFMRDASGLCQRMTATHGPNFRIKLFGAPMLVVGDPEHVREIFLDRQREYSSKLGWKMAIGELFAGGLMLRDFDDHRAHRQNMQSAFSQRALQAYLGLLNSRISQTLDTWAAQPPLDTYAAVKRLTLDIAAEVFMGLPLGPAASTLNRAFMDMVAASIALVRFEVPGLAYGRGMRGRRLLQGYFRTLVRQRRDGSGTDMLSRLCQATDEDGARLTEEEIVNHFIFLIMAAHDTTTSSLSATLWALAQHPHWQQLAAAPMRDASEPRLNWDQREDFETFDRCFDEALRLYPPVPFIGRRTLRETRLGSLLLPPKTSISVCSLVTHFMPEYWRDPYRFDPARFNDDRAEHRQASHVYVPFGGGAHYCLGMTFARLLVRAVAYQLLRRFDLVLQPGYRLDMQMVPIPKPRGGLPIHFKPRLSAR